MLPDINHNGKQDARDYYDDLGGAYYFRPPGLDEPMGCLVKWALILDVLLWLGVILIGILIAI